MRLRNVLTNEVVEAKVRLCYEKEGILVSIGDKELGVFKKLDDFNFEPDYEIVSGDEVDLEVFEHGIAINLSLELDRDIQSIHKEYGLHWLLTTSDEEEEFEYDLTYDFEKELLLWVVDKKCIVGCESMRPFDLVASDLDAELWCEFHDDNEVANWMTLDCRISEVQ